MENPTIRHCIHLVQPKSEDTAAAPCEPFACLVIAIWDAHEQSIDRLWAPLTVVKAWPPEFFGTETVDMRFSAEEKELTSDSRFKGSGGLRMRKCNFAAKDQHPVESFKSSFLHRIADKCAII